MRETDRRTLLMIDVARARLLADGVLSSLHPLELGRFPLLRPIRTDFESTNTQSRRVESGGVN